MSVFDQKIVITNLYQCQQNGYEAILAHFSSTDAERNILLQLPTGTGKSALIGISIFGLAKKKVLILTPGVKLAKQLEEDLDITRSDTENIYAKLGILEPSIIKSLELFVLRLDDNINATDIEDQQIIISNYQQFQDLEKWFSDKHDIFDLILIDEAHHQKASTYQEIISYFPNAKIIGFTATPFRSDGKKIDGKIVYKYHFHQAIKDKIIRNIRIVNVSPQEVELSFIGDGNKKYSLNEILALKEENWFNHGIATSQDSCDSIARKAKEKLDELNSKYPSSKHQIIAAAISKRHAREFIKPAFEKLGLKVGLVSSDEQDLPKNDKVFEDLKFGKIDVIVNIGMLGEGFNHPPLGVAAIFRPYKSLSPYIQFLGRVIRKNDDTPYCYVVSHVGLNQMQRFEEFKLFDYEDQKFLEELFSEHKEEDSFVKEPEGERDNQKDESEASFTLREVGDDRFNFESQFVKSESDLQDIAESLKRLSPEARIKLQKLYGIEIKDTDLIIDKQNRRLKPVDKRKANRNLLNEKEKSIMVDVIKKLGLQMYDRDFNPLFTNLAWVKKKVSKVVNTKLGIKNNQRKNITSEVYEKAEREGLLNEVEKECSEYFDAKLKEKKLQ